ncbi:HpcH/HpaI aldolase/citrate lyase family protein [Actinoplanes regularis]|uniref:HpcH/HpaI aldolase/citrate lyase family protein n=1 Tax=Actinoplanes regularis TaxID=52697 RepID=UPI001A51D87B|nr:CoA ester lyase [Actinoplanes regularis]GIE90320.1 CoA ester lyase [Actinoplanes regularis]
MRSFLYVPGNRPAMLASALSRGADALIVDLEDAVPPAEKSAARAAVSEWLWTLPSDAPVWVRVNAGPAGLDDARELLTPGPAAVRSGGAVPASALGGVSGPAVARSGGAVPAPVLPEVSGPAAACSAGAAPVPALRGLVVAKASPDQVFALGELLNEADPGGALGIVPLLETPQAILAAAEMAAAPRVTRMQIGEADLAAELGVTPGEDERELLLVRSTVVLASAAAGIEPPAAAVSTDFRDLDALRRSTQALKRLGFHGRACIHPAQLPIVHAVFTPSESEIAAARDLITRFDSAAGGVCLDARGRMVDLAVIRHARRTLAYTTHS